MVGKHGDGTSILRLERGHRDNEVDVLALAIDEKFHSVWKFHIKAWVVNCDIFNKFGIGVSLRFDKS